jgi:hypothetical protein
VEHVLQSHFATLCRRIQESEEAKKPLNMSDIFRSLAVDVVSDICLPQWDNLLETEDYGKAHSECKLFSTWASICLTDDALEYSHTWYYRDGVMESSFALGRTYA